MNLWSLAPMFADVPRGIPLIATVYMQGENTLRIDRPGLRCLRKATGPDELYFDKEAAADLAAYLKANGVDEADLDWEPDNAGDRSGWTDRNRKLAEWIVREFRNAGVRLTLIGTPTDALGWMARLNDDRLVFSAYPMGTDREAWRVRRLEELCLVRKLAPRCSVRVELCPHWLGAKEYDGKPLPPWREFVGGPMWDVMTEFASANGNALSVWASGVKTDGSGYDDFDYHAPWLGVFGKGR